MQWDFNEGRWTTTLPDGVVVHAEQVPEGWLVLIPAERWRDLIRNKHLKTWLSAQLIVEQVVRAHYEWDDPHKWTPEVESIPPFKDHGGPLPEEQLLLWAHKTR